MREIKLTQGRVAIVDDSDFEYLNDFKWCYNSGYAIRGVKIIGSKKVLNIKMHRVIAGTPSDFDTDHINGDTLDNRRENLRICSHVENVKNRGVNKNNSSGYKGVYKRKNRYVAEINAKGIEKKYLGMFKTKEEAAIAYNAAATKTFGVFAKLNVLM